MLLEPKTFTEEVLGRLKTLKESEKAQMEAPLSGDRALVR